MAYVRTTKHAVFRNLWLVRLGAGETQMTTFNGHKNWTHWNVSLWINNDEGLYRMALRLSKNKTKPAAARAMLEALHSLDAYKTPDGATYSLTNIRAAMRDM